MRSFKLTGIGLISTFIILACAGWQMPSASSSAAQSFDICIEDDSNKANALRFNSSTGEYTFCTGGNVSSGKGSVSKMGNTLSLQHNDADRRVVARVDTIGKKASGLFQSPPGTTRATIMDGNTADSRCGCK